MIVELYSQKTSNYISNDPNPKIFQAFDFRSRVGGILNGEGNNDCWIQTKVGKGSE
jgi:hypothetical protein